MSGSDEEFDDLYRRHRLAVLRYVRRRLVTADVEDVVGEVFTIAWRRRGDVPGGSGQLPWLYGTARRVLANEHRRARRVRALTDRLESENQPLPGGADPSDQVARLVDVARAFDRLADDDQELLRLVAWELLDTADVARVVGCSRPAAAMRIGRARRRLRAYLEQPDIDQPDIDQRDGARQPSAAPTRQPTSTPDPEREVRR